MKIQYTIRNIPPELDRRIRKRSKQAGLSFNQTVVELLSLQVLGATKPSPEDNFDWLRGAMVLDESFDETIAWQSGVDEEVWK